MNCIKEAENYLRYYRQLKRSIEHADKMIERLKWETRPKDIKASQTEATGVHADHPVNTLNQLYELQKWQEIKACTLEKLTEIDEVLNSICEERGCERYKDILIMWYVDKLDKEKIAEAINYSKTSRKSIYQIKKIAIKKFAISLFGIEALQAI